MLVKHALLALLTYTFNVAQLHNVWKVIILGGVDNINKISSQFVCLIYKQCTTFQFLQH